MGHYKSNLRDIEFTLFELLRIQDRLGSEPFGEVDEETARGILVEVERLAAGPVAESLLDSDRNPPVFDPQTHSARLPESFKKSFRAYMDAEWWRMQIPAEIGGTVVPASLRWAAEEMVLGANPAVHMYASGMSFSTLSVCDRHRGPEEVGPVDGGQAVGLDDDPHRAGRGLRRRRGAHEGDRAA